MKRYFSSALLTFTILLISSNLLQAQLCGFSINQEGRMRFIGSSYKNVMLLPSFNPELQLQFAMKTKALRMIGGIGYTQRKDASWINPPSINSRKFVYNTSTINCLTIPLFMEYGNIGRDDNPGFGLQAGIRAHIAYSGKVHQHIEDDGIPAVEREFALTEKNMFPEFFVKPGFVAGINKKFACGLFLGYHLTRDLHIGSNKNENRFEQAFSASLVVMLKNGKW